MAEPTISLPATPTTPQAPQVEHPNAAKLENAKSGFDAIFVNDIGKARAVFEERDDPFHVMGLGVCAFMEAALGMESGLMTEASRCLGLAEAGSRQEVRVPQPRDLAYQSRFHHGLEWEILNADAVVLLGMTHALSESYMGYVQCLYSLNSAHTKFTKLYKTVFPAGIPSQPILLSADHLKPPSAPASPGLLPHKASSASISSHSSFSSNTSGNTSVPAAPTPPKPSKGFFSRLVGSAAASSTSLNLPPVPIQPDGPIEEFIEAGTAFGFGLFNLVFSFLPKKVQGVVGFLGFQHDRKLAMSALSYAASKEDVHGVFAALILMTYLGVLLLLGGYQANEKKILVDYKLLVDRIEAKYPAGALWILNRAKILRMSHDPEAAIVVLREGLRPGREQAFVQADTLLMFELAWTLLGQRKYAEAAEAFIKLTELNSWSHATYYFIAAGCHLATGEPEKAQNLLDQIPDLIDKRKISGKDLPTEVFIKKKLAFYQEKQAKLGGDASKYVECIKINPAEELALFWNTHSRIDPSIARAHIEELSALTPKLPSTSKSTKISPSDDLNTPDELAIRALILGVNYRTAKEYDNARTYLKEAHATSGVKTSTWVAGVAVFELAVLELKEMEAKENEMLANETPEKKRELKKEWEKVMKSATAKLDTALGLAGSSIDLSSRLDSRITMLRDQLVEKKELLGLD